MNPLNFSAAIGRAAAVVLMTQIAHGQIADSPDENVGGIPVNYTEAKVGGYTLPDPLTLNNGRTVTSDAAWFEQRRPQIVRLFEAHQFGASPSRPENLAFDIFDKGTPAFDGHATRRQVTVYFSPDKTGPQMDLLVYVPAEASGPVPLLLNISFAPNSLTVDDPGVKPGMMWNRDGERVLARDGDRRRRVDVPMILDQGFGFATVYYGDMEPDFAGGAKHGVRSLFPRSEADRSLLDQWGAIAAWGWGLSRALDYLETDNAVDAQRVAIIGFSRLGKTVLWAGARDQRFGLVIAVCSGEGGAALSRRNYGENVAHLAARFDYWFCPNYQNYADNVAELPVDAHMLFALIAPRPVLLVTGNGDKWADPYGEFLAAEAASPVYQLLGKRGLAADQPPPLGEPVLNDMGYIMHDGGHGIFPSDWDVILKFMDMHLKQ